MIYIIVAFAICAGDLAIKYYIEKKRTFSQKSKFLKGSIVIEKSHNKGVCLNMLEKYPKFVLGLSGVLIGVMIGVFAMVLPKQRKRLLKWGLSLCIGGAAGNFLDRLYRGYVVDYLNFPKVKPVKNIDFNISDLFILLGSFLLAIYNIFRKDS